MRVAAFLPVAPEAFFACPGGAVLAAGACLFAWPGGWVRAAFFAWPGDTLAAAPLVAGADLAAGADFFACPGGAAFAAFFAWPGAVCAFPGPCAFAAFFACPGGVWPGCLPEAGNANRAQTSAALRMAGTRCDRERGGATVTNFLIGKRRISPMVGASGFPVDYLVEITCLGWRIRSRSQCTGRVSARRCARESA